MTLFQRLNCIRGKHERSRGKAWQDDAIFRSQCRGCGKPMMRTPSGWILDPADSAGASPTDA